MVWKILRKLIGRRSSDTAPASLPAPDAASAPPSGAVGVQSPFDMPEDDGARESLRARISDFEASLLPLSQLPDHFRMLLPAVETSLSSSALLRNKLESVEQALAQEQSKHSVASLELSMVKSDLERVEFGFKREEAAHVRQRERNVEIESALADFRRDNAELQAKVARLETLHREVAMQKDTIEIEHEKLKSEKKRIEEISLENAREFQLLREQVAKEADIVNSLRQSIQKSSERIEEAQNEIFDRDNTIATINEKLAAATSTLTRERGVIRGLRADNEQLLKEREENKAQFESQLDAAKGRFRLVERLLEESRARFQTETQQLSLIKREKSQRDYDITQLSTALEAARAELSDLRAHTIAGSETLGSVNAMLASETEKRKRLEFEIDMLREENSKLAAQQKTISTVSFNEQLALEETSKELQSRIAALRNENAQLRSELNALRYGEPHSDTRLAGLDVYPKEEDGTQKVVPINR
jgi:chromosome segregation ATPase